MPLKILLSFLLGGFADKGKDIAWGIAKFGSWALFTIAAFTFMLTTILTMLNAVKVSVPATVVQVWGWVMPDNAVGCLTLILTAKVLRAMYDFKVRMATIKLESVR